MKYKVADLEGALLDAAVALADGAQFHTDTDYGCATLQHNPSIGGGDKCWMLFKPSTSWEQGGPIIERERIATLYGTDDPDCEFRAFWIAGMAPRVSHGAQCDSGWLEMPAIHLANEQCGTTPLIAAMRAYVASKFGDEVEL